MPFTDEVDPWSKLFDNSAIPESRENPASVDSPHTALLSTEITAKRITISDYVGQLVQSQAIPQASSNNVERPASQELSETADPITEAVNEYFATLRRVPTKRKMQAGPLSPEAVNLLLPLIEGFIKNNERFFQKIATVHVTTPALKQLFSSNFLGAIKAAEDTNISSKSTKPYPPNFFKLDEEHQMMVVDNFGSEWLQLHDFLRSCDPQLVQYALQNDDKNQLNYVSVDELKGAIRRNSRLPAAVIAKHFLFKPTSFKNDMLAYEKTSKEWQRKEAINVLHSSNAPTQESMLIENNARALETLLASDVINKSVRSIRSGETIAISPANRPIPILTFDRLINQHIQVVARGLYEDVAGTKSRAVLMRDWTKYNIGAIMRGTFNGVLRNVTISRSDVTEQVLKEVFKEKLRPGADTLAHFAQIILGAELKSGGRAPELALVRFLIVAEMTTAPLDVIYKNKYIISNTEDIVSRLQQQSRNRARLIEAWMRRGAYSAF